jgi:protein TonB
MQAMTSPELAYTPKKSASGVLVVLGMHLLLGWALVSGLAQRMVEVVRSPIETRLIDEVKPPPPPAPPDLPRPTVPPPAALQVPVPVVIPQAVPPPQITTPPPAPAAPPTVHPTPVEAIRAPAPAPSPAPAPAAAGRTASPEEIYIGSLRTYLNGIKRYPTSREARQLRPQGTVRLKLEIDRAGQLLNATVESTSGSLLLDNEALRTVRNGRFPAIPAEAFAGQATRVFIVPVEYLHEGA